MLTNASRAVRRSIAVIVAILSAGMVHAADEPKLPAAKSIDGVWQGALDVGTVKLRLIIRVGKDPQGRLKAAMDSIDQGVRGIPIDTITHTGDDVNFEIKRIKGTFAGKLSADGGEIKGLWKQGPPIELVLKRLDKEPDEGRPQDPKKPYPYGVQDVTFENAAANVTLAGTLTLPKSDTPTPAVLLISGSGAQDRDESLMGHKPFLVLADHLTRHGIAVLRVDDRGVGGSTGDTANSTTDDLTSDALAGVAWLKTRREINPKQIGLIGHSEGGMIAPLAATRSPDVAFIVMMAGTGVTGEQILYHQGDLIATAMGLGAEAVATNKALQEQLFKIVKAEPDRAKAEPQVREVLDAAAAKATGGASPETIRAQAEAQVASIFTPWFRYFLTYDPQVALRKVRCPVLAINGEKDLQVDPKQNLQPIAAALKEAGNANVTIKEFPGLNHLFQHCKTGAPAEYGTIEETFAPEALELISTWIKDRKK